MCTYLLLSSSVFWNNNCSVHNLATVTHTYNSSTGGPRQEDHKLEASLSYRVTPCFKNPTKYTPIQNPGGGVERSACECWPESHLMDSAAQLEEGLPYSGLRPAHQSLQEAFSQTYSGDCFLNPFSIPQPCQNTILLSSPGARL